MTIKKAFVELNSLLVANKDKTIGEMYDQLAELMSAKVSNNGPTSYKDAEGNVIAIFCYYHKKWELVSEHSYGTKAGTTTGLNTMCKLGVNAWSAQQRKARNMHTEVLAKVQRHELAPELIGEELSKIEEYKASINFSEDYKQAFDSIEELEAYLSAVPKVKRSSKKKIEEQAEVTE